MSQLVVRTAIEPLPWDTEFLGRGIGRIHVAGLSADQIRAAEDDARAMGIECLYAELDPSDPQPTYEIQKLGYRFVEASNIFSLPADYPPRVPEADVQIRPATMDDLPHMHDAVALLAPWTRYAVDPHFGVDVGFRLQMASIERAVQTNDREALVAVEEGQVTAFIAMQLEPVPFIDTAATLKKGSGAARTLMEHGRQLAPGADVYAGKTAARNRNVTRFLHTLGYSLHSVEYRYHRWFEED